MWNENPKTDSQSVVLSLGHSTVGRAMSLVGAAQDQPHQRLVDSRFSNASTSKIGMRHCRPTRTAESFRSVISRRTVRELTPKYSATSSIDMYRRPPHGVCRRLAMDGGYGGLQGRCTAYPRPRPPALHACPAVSAIDEPRQIFVKKQSTRQKRASPSARYAGRSQGVSATLP